MDMSGCMFPVKVHCASVDIIIRRLGEWNPIIMVNEQRLEEDLSSVWYSEL